MYTVVVYICYAFYILELQTANSKYEEKLKSGCVVENTMFSLSWDIEELKHFDT